MSEQKPYYRVDEPEGVCENYELLVGPNDFECLLTEPEDRTWLRDGRAVINELNRQHAEIQRVRGQRDKALIDLAAKNHDILFADLPMAQCVTLADHGFRVLSYHGTRMVEEIES